MEPRQQVSHSLYFQLYSALSTSSPGATLTDSPSEPWLVVPKFGKQQNHKAFVKEEGAGPACRVSNPAGRGRAWEPAFLTSSWCCGSGDQEAENHWWGLTRPPVFLCPFLVTFFEKKLGPTCVFCLDSPLSRDSCLPLEGPSLISWHWQEDLQLWPYGGAAWFFKLWHLVPSLHRK